MQPDMSNLPSQLLKLVKSFQDTAKNPIVLNLHMGKNLKQLFEAMENSAAIFGRLALKAFFPMEQLGPIKGRHLLIFSCEIKNEEHVSQEVDAPFGSKKDRNYTTKYGINFDVGVNVKLKHVETGGTAVIFSATFSESISDLKSKYEGKPSNFYHEVPLSAFCDVLHEKDEIVFGSTFPTISQEDKHVTPRRNPLISKLVDDCAELKSGIGKFIAYAVNHCWYEQIEKVSKFEVAWAPLFEEDDAAEDDAVILEHQSDQGVKLEAVSGRRLSMNTCEHVVEKLEELKTSTSSSSKKILFSNLLLLSEVCNWFINLADGIEEFMLDKFYDAIGGIAADLKSRPSKVINQVGTYLCNKSEECFGHMNELNSRSCGFQLKAGDDPLLTMNAPLSPDQLAYLQLPSGGRIPIKGKLFNRFFLQANPRQMHSSDLMLSCQTTVGSPLIFLSGEIINNGDEILIIPFSSILLNNGKCFKQIINAVQIPSNGAFNDAIACLPSGASDFAQKVRSYQLASNSVAFLIFDPQELFQSIVGINVQGDIELETIFIDLLRKGGSICSLPTQKRDDENDASYRSRVRDEALRIINNADRLATEQLERLRKKKEEEERNRGAFRSMPVYRSMGAKGGGEQQAEESSSKSNGSGKKNATANALASVLDALDTESIDSESFSGAVLNLTTPLIGELQFVDPENSTEVVRTPESFALQNNEERLLHLNIWTSLLEAASGDEQEALKARGIFLSGMWFHTAPALGHHLIQGGPCPVDQYAAIAKIAKSVLGKRERD